MTILDKIIANKKRELALISKSSKIRDLEKKELFKRAILPLSGYLLNPEKTGIIAEFKRKSPSGGTLNSEADPAEVTMGYSRFGASGLSVLTDKKFFGGCNSDLSRAREHNTIPILRKDFIIDEYQIVESRSIGADAILLLASVLGEKEVFNLARFARSLELEVLLEVHNPDELNMANEYVNIIGVNNRDLKTFDVHIELSENLADKIPGEFVKISESGISSPAILKNLKSFGYNGFLIGGSFMNTPDPVFAFSDFVRLIN
jgi:indole-3-glycerol phosphate synthase